MQLHIIYYTGSGSENDDDHNATGDNFESSEERQNLEIESREESDNSEAEEFDIALAASHSVSTYLIILFYIQYGDWREHYISLISELGL